MEYTIEQRRAYAQEAIAYKKESKGTYSQYAAEHGLPANTLHTWIKRYTEKTEGGSFVKLGTCNTGMVTGTIRIMYHGAVIEADKGSLEAVLKAVKAVG